ncbi:MAG: C-type lectin domain-containing protein [Oscillospiraceae bacterium]
MVIPQNVSDNYGDVKVWVSTDQEISLTLGNSYTIYNTNIDRVTYSYTPEESGIYVLNTEWNVGDPDDAEYLPDGHRFGVHLSKDTANEDDSSYREDIYTWWENADEPDYKYVYLNAGENYYFRFDQDQMQTSNITFSLTKETPTALTVDDVITETMAYDDVSNVFGGQWYSYTTSTEGNYLLTLTNDLIENEYEGQNYDSHIVIYKDNECIRDDWQNYNEFEQSIELGAGQTVLMYVAPSTENGLKYRLAIRDYNQPFNTNLLAGHTWENADNDYTAISSENAEGFILNVTDVGEENWDTQAFIRDFPIFGSNYYKLTFNLDADTESENTPTVLLQQSHEPYTNYGEGHWINTNEKTFTFCFAVDENGNSGLTKLLFDGFGIGTYEFNNVELVRITEEEYTELTRNYQPIQFQPTESENIEGMGNTFNGHTYAVIPYETDPITAQELCEANGGHLVTITSQAEQDFVASLAANVDYEQFWLGGSDNGSEGEWYWMNGETWDYTAWSTASEPNNGEGNGDENYLLMWRSRNYEWGDAYGEYDNHSTKLYFICEWDDENYGESTGEGGSEDVLIIDEE